MQTSLTIDDLDKRETIHVAHAGSLVLTRYHQTSPADLDRLLRLQLQVAKRHDGQMSMLSFVALKGTEGRISDELRKKSVEIIGQLSAVCRGSATVVIGVGLSATMVRLFLTGFYLLSNPPFPQSAFSTVAEGLSWVQRLPGQKPELGSLTAAAIIKHFGLTGAR